MPKITRVQIDHAGQKWSGSWEIEGKDVVVASAYGSDREPLGRRDPVKLAARLLREIVVSRHEKRPPPREERRPKSPD